MAELGFLGANLEGYGCAGMSNVEYGLIMQELERADSGMRSFVSVQGALVMYPILTYGSEEQKQKWLPRAAEREGRGMLRADGAGFRIEPGGHAHHRAARRRLPGCSNGEKTWITNGTAGRRGRGLGARRRRAFAGFLVERGTPGYTTSDIHGKWSMRASVTSSLSFADCRVQRARPAAGRQGTEGAAVAACRRRATGSAGASSARPWIATRRRAQYSILRKQFDDRPIASHQLVQEKLAWMITEITKAQLLARAGGAAEGPGQARAGAHFHAEAQQRGHGARMRAAQPRPAGRQRNHGRISHHASPLQPGNRQDV